MGKYGVFISHRVEDKQIAASLKTALENLSKYELDIFVCEETQGGTDWRQEIEKNIKNSKVMIFLYTDDEKDEADWKWCLYELGLFQGKNSSSDNKTDTNECKIICIKRPDLAPPSPIENTQACNADEDGIKQLFNDLLCQKSIFGEPINDELHTKMQKDFDDHVNKVFHCFVPPMKTQFGTPLRMCIKLSEATGIKIDSYKLEEAHISGKEPTMAFLQLPVVGCNWRKLSDTFKNKGQNAWLDQLSNSIEKIKDDIYPEVVMQPFISHDGNPIIPVISRIEKFKTKDTSGNWVITPKRLYIIFIPMPKGYKSASALQNMREIVDKWVTYPPLSVVIVKWRQQSGDGKYDMGKDILENPAICCINPAFANLFDFTYDTFVYNEKTQSNNLTSSKLFNKIEKYVEKNHFEKLKEDQRRLFERIVVGNNDDIAVVPLQFKDSHPNNSYKNQSYLPYLVCKQIEGDINSQHETYLLICYIKHFCHLDYQQSPFAEKAEIMGNSEKSELPYIFHGQIKQGIS